jgi:hypothetical protein
MTLVSAENGGADLQGPLPDAGLASLQTSQADLSLVIACTERVISAVQGDASLVTTYISGGVLCARVSSACCTSARGTYLQFRQASTLDLAFRRGLDVSGVESEALSLNLPVASAI